MLEHIRKNRDPKWVNELVNQIEMELNKTGGLTRMLFDSPELLPERLVDIVLESISSN